MDFAVRERIGLGKKTTLGYGEIASFEVKQRSNVTATWVKSLAGPIFENDKLALIKNLPYDRIFARREMQDEHIKIFSVARQFALVAANEIFGAYCPPYWLREHNEHNSSDTVQLFRSAKIE